MSTFNYKASFSYKGTGYLGWQMQNVNAGGPTVQAEILKVLKQIAKVDATSIADNASIADNKDTPMGMVKILGSGRTDTGVHALEQVTKITLPINVPPHGLCHALNSLLPSDIRATKVEYVSEDFHPIRDAVSKEYIYYFVQEKLMSPFCFDLVSTYTHELDFDLIQEGLALIKGQHDFAQFRTMGTDTPTTVRTIFEAKVLHIPPYSQLPWLNIKSVAFSFRGDGFLKQMVRLLVGSLWNLGRGKIELSAFEKALQGADTIKAQKLGAVAPPNGLYLKEVYYK